MQSRSEKLFYLITSIILILLASSCYATTNTERISGKPQQVPVNGMVTLLDIGAHSCVPCKMMAPILKELAVDYEGKAAIAFLDIWEYQDEGKKYKIRAIPTQIFFDSSGKEVLRHVGYLSKEQIISQFTKLGVPVGN
jgi:thioredoxin 1